MTSGHFRQPIKEGDQFKEISRIRRHLSKFTYSSFRNYQEGSVYVERGGNIIGVCFDGIEAQILQDLNPDASAFPYLQDLVIRGSKIETIPDWVWEFDQVENLVLKSLHISDLKDLLESLTSIKFLALPGNKLRELPSLHHMESLFRINLNKNKFELMPKELSSVVNLIDLTIDQNFLQETPDEFISHNLQAVSLKHNQLSTFPPFLQDQTYLHHLDISSNFIEVIPDWISVFPMLQHLDLSHNRIRQITSHLSKLKHLRRLYLQHNEVDNVPVVILSELKDLLDIDIRHNPMPSEKLEKLIAFLKISDRKLTLKA